MNEDLKPLLEEMILFIRHSTINISTGEVITAQNDNSRSPIGGLFYIDCAALRGEIAGDPTSNPARDRHRTH